MNFGPLVNSSAHESNPSYVAAHLYVSTRANPTAPWSEPMNLGAPNTTGGELEESISFDGMTLLFSGTQTRPGGSLGRQDVRISTQKR